MSESSRKREAVKQLFEINHSFLQHEDHEEMSHVPSSPVCMERNGERTIERLSILTLAKAIQAPCHKWHVEVQALKL